jgi:hypothetical protein
LRFSLFLRSSSSYQLGDFLVIGSCVKGRSPGVSSHGLEEGSGFFLEEKRDRLAGARLSKKRERREERKRELERELENFARVMREGELHRRREKKKITFLFSLLPKQKGGPKRARSLCPLAAWPVF